MGGPRGSPPGSRDSGSLSATDLVTALFFYKMRYDPKDPWNPAADRLVLRLPAMARRLWQRRPRPALPRNLLGLAGSGADYYDRMLNHIPELKEASDDLGVGRHLVGAGRR